MDIQIIYIIKTLLMPIASLPLLSLIGLLFFRKRTYSELIIGLPLFCLLILSLPVVSKSLAANTEPYPAINLNTLNNTKAQAIVVLGGGLRNQAPEYPGQITLSYYALERIRYAARIARLTKLPIMVSGGTVINQNIPAEAEILAQVLIEEFNQPVRWQESKSHNTAENAIFSSKLLKQHGISNIILVTHAMHMHRAVIQFENQGMRVTPAPTVFYSSINTPKILRYMPTIKALDRSTFALHEWMGRVWYRLRY